MTKGVGGRTAEEALDTLSDMTVGAVPIASEEFQSRIDKAQALMTAQGLAALYLHAGTSLYYFTGTRWRGSERMVGAVLFPDGPPLYIAPEFEKGTIEQFMTVQGEVATWEEHESPYGLIAAHLARSGVTSGTIGLDEATPFFVSDGLAKASPNFTFTNGASVTAACRMIKSPNELALMKRAKEMTLAVHKAAASMLYAGITTTEVGAFLDEKQRQVWEAEKAAQAKAFEAAQIGVRCGDVDLAARAELEKHGFGPGYKTPGLPHRTGHGIGLDIHEWPYLNWGDDTPLAPGGLRSRVQA